MFAPLTDSLTSAASASNDRVQAYNYTRAVEVLSDLSNTLDLLAQFESTHGPAEEAKVSYYYLNGTTNYNARRDAKSYALTMKAITLFKAAAPKLKALAQQITDDAPFTAKRPGILACALQCDGHYGQAVELTNAVQDILERASKSTRLAF